MTFRSHYFEEILTVETLNFLIYEILSTQPVRQSLPHSIAYYQYQLNLEIYLLAAIS